MNLEGLHKSTTTPVEITGRSWSTVLGGAGIKGGQTYGATSDDGTEVKENPRHRAELHGHNLPRAESGSRNNQPEQHWSPDPVGGSWRGGG